MSLKCALQRKWRVFPLGGQGPGGVGDHVQLFARERKRGHHRHLLSPSLNKELHFTLAIAREVVTCFPYPLSSSTNLSLRHPFLHFQSMGEVAPTA